MNDRSNAGAAVRDPHSMHFTSHEADDLERVWKTYVPTAALRRLDPQSFRFRWDSHESRGVSVVDYELVARIRSVVEPEDQLLACRVQGPSAQVSTRKGVLDAGLPWLTDGSAVEAAWDSARVRALIFERASAEDLARRMTGDDEFALRVHEMQPERREDAAHWERTFGYLAQAFDRLCPDDEIIGENLRLHALSTTLSVFSTSFHDAMRVSRQRRPATRTVRRALAFIEENAHRAITVPDIAAAVHMSDRGLQYAFRRALDSTPNEQLRRARLHGSRRELLDGRDEAVVVVAKRWGFPHPSRYVAAYREEFGEHPAQTARRGQG